MERDRIGCKRWMRWIMVSASLAAAPFLYSSCGGGENGISPPAVPTYGTVVIAGGSVDSIASTQPNAATPDSVTLTIQDAQISADGDVYTSGSASISIDSNTGGVVDVVTDPGGKFAESGQNEIPSGAYKAIKLTLSDISWHATWTPPSLPTTKANPSPCNGAVSGEDNGSVDLGGHTDFYFKTPDLGGNTPTYYREYPPTSGYPGDVNHPFVLASPVKVVANAITTVNLILGIGNTLVCNGLNIYDTSGIPLQTIGGTGSGLSSPVGVFADTAVSPNEIGVANSGNDSITLYNRTGGNYSPIPLVTISGANTGLSSPTGIYLDTANSEIGVANSGNDSITVYDRTASGDALPNRPPISGYFTGLSKPMGIYLDTDHNEIAVANGGNNSITIYDRLAFQDAAPLYTIKGGSTGLNSPVGVYVDTTNHEIGVANSGNDTVTIYSRDDVISGIAAGQLIGAAVASAGKSVSVNDTLLLQLNGDTTQTITFPTKEANDGTAVAVQIQSLVRLLASSSTISPSLQAAYGNFTATFDGTRYYTLTSGLAGPNSSVVVTGGTKATDFQLTQAAGAQQIVGTNVAPSYTLVSGTNNPLLSGPTGIYLDTANSEIGVANKGNGSITIYRLIDIMNSTDGNVAPIQTFTAASTNLNSPMGIYLDTANSEIGVTNNGQQVVMESPPSLFPSATNADPGAWPLSGSYNLILYGGEIDHTTPGGIKVPRFFAERTGNSSAVFNPPTTATPWPTFSFSLDTKIERRIGDPTGNFQSSQPPANCNNTSSGDVTTGTYGVNTDGSFYAILDGHEGTLQGTVEADGSAFVASTYDSSNRLMLVYGVQAASGTPYLTSDGTSGGLPTDYLFASYRATDLYNYTFDPTVKQQTTIDTLQYQLSIGVAEAEAQTTETITGLSGDANFISILNPTGFFEASVSPGPVYRQGFVSLPAQGYDPHPNGLLENTTGGLAGALTSDGSTWIVVSNTQGCDDLGFGMGLRASPAGNFSTGSLRGTYFTAAFGDRFDSTSRASSIRSTGGTITFDGAGNATLTLVENENGVLSPFNQINLTYQVGQQFIPALGSPAITADVVNLFIPSFPDPYASALIGPKGQSLIFFRSLFLRSTGTANQTRLLGLALLQTP
jgi:hypothetical protein